MKNSSNPDWVSILRQSIERRSALRSCSNAIRYLNGIGDGFDGVVLDLYNKHAQLQFFKRIWIGEEAALCAAIIEVFSPDFLVIKERLDPNGLSLAKPNMRVIHGELENSKTQVFEGGAQFFVDLMDTVNPGLFLDMRAHRLSVSALASGGEMLNLFCYTGSFSVHARLAGALRCINVDVSAKILERVRENYALNNIETVKGEFFKGDSLEYLQYANRKALQFNAIVLDPPSFSRHEGGIFQVSTQLGALIRLCATILAPNGHLLVSTNYSEMTEESLREIVRESFAINQILYNIVWVRGQDQDFIGSGNSRESALVACLIQRRIME